MASYDVIITAVLAVVLFLIRYLYDVKNNKKLSFEVGRIVNSILSAGAIYGGAAGVWLGIFQELPFNQTNIISPAFISLIGGAILLWFGVATFLSSFKQLKNK